MSSIYTVKASAKIVRLVAYLQAYGGSLGAGLASEVMDCKSKQVAGLVVPAVKRNLVIVTPTQNGQMYGLNPKLIATLRGAWVDLELDGWTTEEENEFYRVKHLWVNAADVPMPAITAPISIFHFGGASHAR